LDEDSNTSSWGVSFVFV